MIKTQNLVPKVYYDESRDFQVFGRVLDAVANYYKQNIRDEYLTEDSRMLQLLARTMGFDLIHEYALSDLRRVCSAFRGILRKKGSLSAIEDCVRLLMSAQGISGDATVSRSASDPYAIVVGFPSKNVDDIVLLEDLMEYMLPAGMTFDYTYSSSQTTSTEMTSTDELCIKPMTKLKYELGKVAKWNSSNVISNISTTEHSIYNSMDADSSDEDIQELAIYSDVGSKMVVPRESDADKEN